MFWDFFVFSFYSETIWNNATEIFCVGTPLLWRKVFLIWKEIWTYMGKKHKKKTLCVNSSMNLITAVCAQIEWVEHSRPVDRTDSTLLVELVSYCHSIHILTQNEIQKKRNKNTNKQKQISRLSSMDVLTMPDSRRLRCQFRCRAGLQNGKQAESVPPHIPPHPSVRPTSQVVPSLHPHHRRSHHSARRRSTSDGHLLL